MSLAPVGASNGNSSSQPAATNAAAVGLPVNAYQAGAWNVGVNSLPPVSGTVGATQNGPWTVGVDSLPPVSGTVGATQNGPWTVDVGSLPPVELAGTPTVNVANLPEAVAPPLWQGTPFVETRNGSKSFRCQDVLVPEGMVLFLERAVSNISFATASQKTPQARLEMTSAGGYGATVVIPSTLGPPEPLFGDVLYTGALDIGLPVTELSICMPHELSSVTVWGYLVPAPAPTG